MKITITKVFKFEAAHFLPDYDGACRNIHGHSYKLHVTFSAHRLVNDMILDAKSIKEMILPEVNNLDHSIIVNKYKEHPRGTKTYHLHHDPTTEQLTLHLFRLFEKYLEERIPDGRVVLEKVKLQETDTLYVEVTNWESKLAITIKPHE